MAKVCFGTKNVTKVFVGRPSKCIYRMIQYFFPHGIGPWFLTHSCFRVFCSFLENRGFVAINADLPYIYEGMNNNYLDQFGGNLIVKVKMEGIMMGL